MSDVTVIEEVGEIQVITVSTTNTTEVITVEVPGPQGPAGNDGVDGTDGVGIPVGGEDGQFLVKSTVDDFDVQWVTRTHGDFAGLEDDDHPQYHTDDRGDARYYTKTEIDASLAPIATLQTGLDDLNASKGVANGVVVSDADNKIPVSQIPAIALVDVYVVADIAARDALTVQEGDVASVTDTGGGIAKTYVYGGSSWIELRTDGALAAHSAQTTGIHGVTGNIVGTSDAQVLTNKDIDGGTASNASRITIPKNTLANLQATTAKAGTVAFATDIGKLYYNDGTNWKAVGSGSGGGGTDYLGDGDAESGLGSWSTYQDAAGTRPVDGLSGSPTLTWTLTTTSPHEGLASWLLTKPASNTQGEGVRRDFNLTAAGAYQMQAITGTVSVASGTYTDDYIEAFVYDITNATVIDCIGGKIKNTGIITPFQILFHPNYNSTQYRLILHNTSSNTTAFSLKFDSIRIGEQVKNYGVPVTDWTSYTPTMSNLGTGSGNFTNTKWRRVADSIEVQYRFDKDASAGSGTAFPSISLPSGLTADATKLPAGIIGTATTNFTSAANVDIYFSGTTIYFVNKSNGSGIQASQFSASSFNIGFFKVPIVGWSSNTVMSSEGTSRIAATRMYRNAAQNVTPNGNWSKINFDAVQATYGRDTIGGANLTSNRYDIKVSDWYDITVEAGIGSTNVLAGVYGVSIFANGTLCLGSDFRSVAANSGGRYQASSGPVYLKAGEYVEGFVYSSNNHSVNTLSLATGADVTRMAISNRSGSQQIAASETVSVHVFNSAASTVGVSNTLIPYASVITNTHGAWNTSTSTFTAPVSGNFRVAAAFLVSPLTLTNTQAIQWFAYKNGSMYKLLASTQGTGGNFTYRGNGTCNVPLLAGETISIYGISSVSATLYTPDTVGSYNYISIDRIGNY